MSLLATTLYLFLWGEFLVAFLSSFIVFLPLKCFFCCRIRWKWILWSIFPYSKFLDTAPLTFLVLSLSSWPCCLRQQHLYSIWLSLSLPAISASIPLQGIRCKLPFANTQGPSISLVGPGTLGNPGPCLLFLPNIIPLESPIYPTPRSVSSAHECSAGG